MQLRQFQYLIHSIDSGSLSRASQALHIAQPALSQQINQLEDELGVKLLTRSVRGVAPTEAGLAVYEQAKLILKQVDATRLIAADADRGPAGTVSLGLPWSLANLVGLELLRQVAATMQQVRLEIVEGPSSLLSGMLSDGKVEIAVLFSDTVNAGLALRPVAVEPLLLIGARDTLGAAREITLEAAAAYPMVLTSRPNPIRDLLETRWLAAGLRHTVVAEINSPSLLIEAVKAGVAYSIVPAAGLEDAVRKGQIDAVPLAGAGLARTVYIGSSRLFASPQAV